MEGLQFENKLVCGSLLFISCVTSLNRTYYIVNATTQIFFLTKRYRGHTAQPTCHIMIKLVELN